MKNDRVKIAAKGENQLSFQRILLRFLHLSRSTPIGPSISFLAVLASVPFLAYPAFLAAYVMAILMVCTKGNMHSGLNAICVTLSQLLLYERVR
jgi:hypothetical protein